MNIIYGGLDVSQQTENWEVSTEEIRDGSNLVRRSKIRTPGGEYVMLSGIDQVNVLQKGTVDETKRVTEEAMKNGKGGGKFIMQPVENVEAYVQTALQFAAY